MEKTTMSLQEFSAQIDISLPKVYDLVKDRGSLLSESEHDFLYLLRHIRNGF